MKVRFFAMTTSKQFGSSEIIKTILLFTPDRHWNAEDVFSASGFNFSHVVWEKELNYEDALTFSYMHKDDFDNLILKTTTENRSFHHDA